MFRKWSIILVFMLLISTTSVFAGESVYLDGYRFDSISMPQKIRRISGEPRDCLSQASQKILLIKNADI